MARALVLDDDLTRQESFRQRLAGYDVVPVTDYFSAVRALRDTPQFDVAFLDHDLVLNRRSVICTPQGLRQLSGANVAAFVATLPPAQRPRAVVIHSSNEAGGAAMEQILQRAGVPVTRRPFMVAGSLLLRIVP